jgi:hypothetical protein
MKGRTKLKYLAKDWRRKELEDQFGRIAMEVFIEELGWCKYSWATGGILVNGKWLCDWEIFVTSD